MKSQNIREGMTLKLKPQRQEAYGIFSDLVVQEIYYKSGYKTPWIKCAEGSFRPSDFQGGR
jgi:hypothetical protein